VAAGAVWGAFAPPARAAGEPLSDALPSPQAVAAHAEFLLDAPPPPPGAGTICMIDTGVTPLPDTASQIVERIAIDGGSPDDVYHVPGDPSSGHGTFVASTIASQVDGYGSAGIWPQAKIVSVRVFKRAGEGATAAAYRSGLSECLKPTRRVSTITISLSAADATAEDLARLRDRLVEAVDDRDVSVVASVGNEGRDSVNFPAAEPVAFAVAASDATGALCAFSNRGTGTDIAAPGCDVRVSSFAGAATFAGTSYSTPVVAAVINALRAYRPEMRASEIEDLLIKTADAGSSAPTLNAASAFRAVGLSAMVPSVFNLAPSAVKTGASQPSGEPSRPSASSSRPKPPRLVRARRHGHVLSLRFTRPRHGSRVVLQIGAARRYSRTGALTVRSSARHGLAWVEDGWGVRSRSVPLSLKRLRR
jgi:subtilisin family serine protease